MNNTIEHLSRTDNLEEWSTITKDLEPTLIKKSFKQAMPLWVERMTKEGKLLFHPEVTQNLIQRQWIPNEIELRMIWANILVNLTGSKSKKSFYRIKDKIIKKYGVDWWEDVYRRQKNTYATKSRLLNENQNTSFVIQTLAPHSSMIALGVHEQRQRALEMLYKK